MSEAKLKMTFTCEGGTGKVAYTYKYADPEVTEANVKALVNALITNGSIFAKPPLTALGAELIVTTTTEYDISD